MRQAIRTIASTGVTIHSVFDSQGRRIAEYNQATGALIREYVWMEWEPVAVIEGGVTSFVRTDHIGRPVFATNTAGTQVWTASYTPFGGVRTTTGTPINARFPGQWFQSESGLHQNWMRDYDPTTGRYLQADPLGLVDGASVYGYAGQSPMANVDPNGQCFGPLIMLAPACAAAAIGILESIVLGYLLDQAIGDGCYTWEEALFDGALGALLGPLGQYGKAANSLSDKGFNGMMKDFLLDESGGMSKALRAAMHAAGKVAGLSDDAHHIVAAGASAAADGRAVLEQYGVGVNSAANGVFLNRTAHQRVHTNDYYRRVNRLLEGATSRDEVLEVLSRIGSGL